MKLFNKTLIATAITVASVNAFAATTAATSGTDLSQEGILNATDIALEDSLVVTLAPTTNTYANANVLRFTMTGAQNTFATNVQLQINAAGANAVVAATNGICNDTHANGLIAGTLGVISVAGGEVSIASETLIEVNLDSAKGQAFRTCLAAHNGTDANVTLTLSEDTADSWKVVADSGNVDDTITLDYAAVSTVGLTGTVDSAKAATMATVIDEYDLNVAAGTDFDGSIDVAEDRMLFASGNTDTIVLAYDVTAADTANVTVANMDYVIETDLSFLDSDGDGTIDTNNSITVDSDGVLDLTDLTAIGVTDANEDGAAITVTVTVDGTREIPETSFAVSSAIKYSLATATEATWPVSLAGAQTEADADSNAGAWALNGDGGAIKYMPYGSNISQVIYVTNETAVAGGLSYTARDEAGTKYSGTLTTVLPANGIAKIAGELKESLAAQGFTSGKLSLQINAEVPSVNVYAAYNVNGSDRGFVSNN